MRCSNVPRTRGAPRLTAADAMEAPIGFTTKEARVQAREELQLVGALVAKREEARGEDEGPNSVQGCG